MYDEKIYETEEDYIHYYEIENDLQPLVFIHAQGVDALSFQDTFGAISKKYHIYSIDCYGHGKSSHNRE